MKKQLLSTSALVAAGMIAASGSTGTAQAQQVVQAPASSPIQISVGGYMRQFVSFFDASDIGNTQTGGFANSQKNAGFRQFSDTEIYFTGKTTLSNGISVAVRVELEGNTSNDMIDETFASVEGAFGRLELGSTDAASAKTFITSPTTGILSNGTWIGVLGVNPVRNGGASGIQAGSVFAVHMNDEDSEKVSYYTPRFEGFQLGLSYIPKATQDSQGGGFPIINSATTYGRGYSAGLNFTRSFGAIDVAASAGYMKYKKPDAATNFNTTTLSDPSMYAFGAQVGYAGFRVGAGYVRVKDLMALGQGAPGTFAAITAPADNITDGNVWDLGATYTFGPASIGVQYTLGTAIDTTGTGLGSGTYEAVSLVGRYTLGPGVDVTAAVFNWKGTGELTVNNTGGADADNQKATGVAAGLALTF